MKKILAFCILALSIGVYSPITVNAQAVELSAESRAALIAELNAKLLEAMNMLIVALTKQIEQSQLATGSNIDDISERLQRQENDLEEIKENTRKDATVTSFTKASVGFGQQRCVVDQPRTRLFVPYFVRVPNIEKVVVSLEQIKGDSASKTVGTYRRTQWDNEGEIKGEFDFTGSENHTKVYSIDVYADNSLVDTLAGELEVTSCQ